MDLVVGVDMATAAVRALAMDGTGGVHAKAEKPLPPPTSPRPGWWEQDATVWWPAVAATLTALAGDLGPAAASVVAVAVCATSGTVLLVDANTEPSGPALTYADQRAAAEAQLAQEAAPDAWRRIGLTIQPSFGLPKWAWLLHNATADGVRLAHAPDVVVARLISGAAPTDWSHALKSGYDPERCEWVREAMAALGIPTAALPVVGRPTEVAGTLHPAAARATGLPTGCAVHLGMTDSCASQIATGAAAPGQAASVLGTTLVLKTASRRPIGDPSGAVYSHRHPDGWWLPGGASNVGGRALRSAFPGRDLAELDAAAARRGPARAVTYPLVSTGERFPFTEPSAEGFWLGEPEDETERYRALLEGVAFAERLGFERLAALGAAVGPALGAGQPSTVAASGGGSASQAWNRIRAATLGVPLVAVPGASTARGACILAAAGSLHPDLATATAAMRARGTEVDPSQEDAGALEDSYQRLRRALIQRGWIANAKADSPTDSPTNPPQNPKAD
ncbi:MAG: FGGY-family carbohydrate kinase [Actinomycetota bacterium]